MIAQTSDFGLRRGGRYHRGNSTNRKNFLYRIMRKILIIILVGAIFFLLVSTISYAKEKPLQKEIPLLELKAQITPLEFSRDKMSDVTISFHLKNGSSETMTIFPKLALFSEVSGWVGPFWFLLSYEASGKKALLQEISTWYGPPGMPPVSSYWEKSRTLLKPGAEVKTEINSCWIPRKLLKEENLSIKSLDPEGMDVFKEFPFKLSDSSVLILKRTCKEISNEMNQRVDFLRPNLVLFFESQGKYDLTFLYSQRDDNGWYKCKTIESSRSSPVSILVP